MSSALSVLGNLVAAECNVSPPTFFVGNTAPDAVQILSLINASGLELVADFEWQALQTEYRFTTQYLSTTGNLSTGSTVVTGIPSTAGLDNTYMLATGVGIPQDTYVVTVNSGTQVTLSQACTQSVTGAALAFGKTKYAMPADFDRIINRTQWDKSKHWEALGPESPQQWQWLKSGYIATGPRIRWRRMGNYFQTWPVIATPEYMGFEYVSNNWVTSAGGTGQSSFQADTDTCIYDDRLIITKAKLKYFQVKGWDTSAFADDFLRLLSIRKATDQGAPMLNMAPGLSQVLVGLQNVPDSGYGT